MNQKAKQWSIGILSAMALAGAGVATMPPPVIQASAATTSQYTQVGHTLYNFNSKGYAAEVGQIKKNKKYYYNSSMKTVRSKSGVHFIKISYNGKSYLLEYTDFWRDYPKG